MTQNFGEYAAYYDLLYSDKDYEAESDYFLGMLTKYSARRPSTVLEFGAGTGAHQAFFRQHELSSLGVELSPEMVVRAHQRGNNVIQGDFRTFRHTKKFDAVLALFHVIGYLPSEADLTNGFKTAAEHLETGGLFVFDFWFKDAVLSQEPEVRVKRVSSEDLDVWRIAEPQLLDAENSVDVNYTIFGKSKKDALWSMKRELHRMRYFSIEDIEILSTANDFEVLTMEETLTGEAPSAKTWNVTACLRKLSPF